MLNWKEHFITNANVNVAVLFAIKIYVTTVTMKNKTTKKIHYHLYKNCIYTIKNTWLRNGKNDGTTIYIKKHATNLSRTNRLETSAPSRGDEWKKNMFVTLTGITYTCWLWILCTVKLNSSSIKSMSYKQGKRKNKFFTQLFPWVCK